METHTDTRISYGELKEERRELRKISDIYRESQMES